ncbi:UNVERIFIED_CONTAM: hypothetical protein Slati_3392800 [Sesamum latifolium]|uniref:Uncharacterized protein n=1 Tax=Sesamum latifolium TaxID=2727402 RepID=A0AAW2UF74_9LAMI
MITTAIRENMATLIPARTITPLDVDASKEEGQRVSLAPAPPVARGQEPPRKVNRMSLLNGSHAWSACRKASKTSSTKLHERPRRSSRAFPLLKKS